VFGGVGQDNAGTIRLTPATNGQFGAVWNKTRINLANDFCLTAEVYLGASDWGADGMAFVMQPNSTAAGGAGGGLGYHGVTPSFVVEYDTYWNSDVYDPYNDHVGLMKNGNVYHIAASQWGQNPVDVGNLEDNQWRKTKILWESTTDKVSVWLDKNYDGDMLDAGEKLFDAVSANIEANFSNFSGEVYWGFTAATGGLNNLQQVRNITYSATARVNTAPTVVTAPTIAASIVRNTATTASFVLADDATTQAQWTFTKSSSNETVVPLGSISASMSSATAGTITITAVTAGTSNVTVNAVDADGVSVAMTLAVTTTDAVAPTTVPPATTTVPPTTVPPATTTVPPATTTVPPTTVPPATTTVPPTTVPPATTTVPPTTVPPATTTVPPTTVPPTTTTTTTVYVPSVTTTTEYVAPTTTSTVLATTTTTTEPPIEVTTTTEPETEPETTIPEETQPEEKEENETTTTTAIPNDKGEEEDKEDTTPDSTDTTTTTEPQSSGGDEPDDGEIPQESTDPIQESSDEAEEKEEALETITEITKSPSELTEEEKEEIVAAVAVILAGGVDTSVATELASNPAVLTSVDVEQATEIFAAIDEDELSDAQGEAIVAAIQEASEEVRDTFEEQVNVFAGAFDSYVALGSTIDVGTRRAVIAVAALQQVALGATVVASTSGNIGGQSSSSNNQNDAARKEEEEEEEEAGEIEGADLRSWLDTISIWVYVNGIRKFSMKKFLAKFLYETLALGFTLSSSIILWVTLSGFTRNVAIAATLLAFAAHYYLVMWKQQQEGDE